MAGELPSQKRRKTEPCRDIFKLFHSNRVLLDGVKRVLNALEAPTLTRHGVCLSKISSCNATCERSFSKAICNADKFRTEENGGTVLDGYTFGNIFQHGFEVLESYLEAPYQVPIQKGARMALAKLLDFLYTDSYAAANKALVENSDAVTDWAVMLSHHLLSKLTVSPSYLLDNEYQGNQRKRTFTCICGCGEKIDGSYGDISLGVPKGWHGRLDILMDAAVKLLPDDRYSPDNDGIQSSFDVNLTSDMSVINRDQLRAQAIVFSFLQQKHHPEYDNYLIPTIAMSRNEFVVCFYDCVNDMLLETPPIEIHDQRVLLQSQIIVLWLTLNYKYFCSGVAEDILQTRYTADFFKLVGEDIERYKDEVRSPWEVKLCTDQYRWLYNPVPYTNKIRKNVNLINMDPNVFPDEDTN